MRGGGAGVLGTEAGDGVEGEGWAVDPEFAEEVDLLADGGVDGRKGLLEGTDVGNGHAETVDAHDGVGGKNGGQPGGIVDGTGDTEFV